MIYHNMQLLPQHTKAINQKQYKVLLAIISIGMIALPTAIYMNIMRATYIVAIVEAVLFFCCIMLFFYIKKLSDYQTFIKISFVILVIFFSLIIYMTDNPRNSPGTFFMTFTVPSLAYVMLGRRVGSIMTFIFGSAILFTYYHSSKIPPGLQVINTYNAVASFLLIWYISHVYETSNLVAITKMQKSSVTDSLTQLYNREIIADIEKLHQEKTTLNYIVIDIDFFKKINDNYGHDAGDAVLVFFAQELTTYFDAIGYVIRLGGEEFAVIVPDTSLEHTHKLCENFRIRINDKKIKYQDNHLSVTFSAGIASSVHDGQGYSALLKIADNRLYKAKNNGRNCVVAA